MRRRLQFRHVPGHSAIHRLRAETKVLGLLASSSLMALVPRWSVIAVGAATAVVVFVISRLPLGVLAPPPRAFLVVLGVSATVSLIAGGEPDVAGIGLGAVLDLARLVALGVVLVFWAALLAWTTQPAAIGLGLGRMVRPLRRVGLPADEIATVIALTVRSLPLMADELRIADDARRSRPEPPGGRHTVRDLIDLGAVVVVGAHRRARELARTLVARGANTAPHGDPPSFGFNDAVATVIVAAVTAVTIILTR